MTPLAVTFPAAGSTLPTPMMAIGVSVIEGMAPFAMSLTSFSLPAYKSTNTTPHIFLMADGLDMGRIYTGTVSTEMVGLKPRRDGGYKSLIGPAVREHRLPRPIASATDAETSVVAPLAIACPLPATVIENASLRPEAGRQTGIAKLGGSGTLFLHRKLTPFGAMQPEVTCLAAASIIARPDSDKGS